MNKSVRYNNIYEFFRACIYTIELFVLFSLQQIPGFLPEIHGGHPILIFPLTLSISILEGNYFSLIWGLISGLILDLSFSRFVGIQVIIMGAVGYFLGKLKNKLFEVNFFTFIILSSLIEPILIFVRFYINYIIKRIDYVDIAVYGHIVPCILYTLLVSPIIYLFNRPISFFLKKKGGV